MIIKREKGRKKRKRKKLKKKFSKKTWPVSWVAALSGLVVDMFRGSRLQLRQELWVINADKIGRK